MIEEGDEVPLGLMVRAHLSEILLELRFLSYAEHQIANLPEKPDRFAIRLLVFAIRRGLRRDGRDVLRAFGFSRKRVVRINDLELELPTLVPRQDCRELVEGQILPVDDDSAIRDVTDRDAMP